MLFRCVLLMFGRVPIVDIVAHDPYADPLNVLCLTDDCIKRRLSLSPLPLCLIGDIATLVPLDRCDDGIDDVVDFDVGGDDMDILFL